jgi:hypothetical protein
MLWFLRSLCMLLARRHGAPARSTSSPAVTEFLTLSAHTIATSTYYDTILKYYKTRLLFHRGVGRITGLYTRGRTAQPDVIMRERSPRKLWFVVVYVEWYCTDDNWRFCLP